MKHAGASALDALEWLIGEIALIVELKQRSRGVFYRKSKSFLHFHEHGEALFADIRSGEDFDRHEVTTTTQQQRFLRLVRQSVLKY
jgi:hypothetical protein